jgi:hypothetical protein
MRTTTKRLTLGTASAALLIAFLLAGNALAQEGADDPGLERFYTAAMGDVGIFPGKLVCLGCDLGTKKCEDGKHRHALMLEGRVHPLVPSTQEAAKQINDPKLTGKNVKVSGKYYEDSGMILVSSVEAAS